MVGLRLILQQMPNLPIQQVGILRLITIRVRLILLQGLGFPILKLVMRVLLEALTFLLIQGFPILMLIPA